MAPLSRAELRQCCQGATRSDLLGFVGDLYATEGWTVAAVDTDASVLTLQRDGTQRRVGVATETTVPDTVETLVLVGELDRSAISADTCLDIEDLRNRLLYSIDREDAATIFQRRFDQPLDRSTNSPQSADARAESEAETDQNPESNATPGPPGHGQPATPPTASENPTANDESASARTISNPRYIGVAGGLLLVVAVLVGGAAMAFSLTDSGANNAASVASDPTPVPVTATTPTDASAGASERPVSARSTPLSAEAAMFPPGVNGSGITAYQRLVSAHQSQLADRSYRVTLVYREVQNGTVTGGTTQTVRVENETTYYATSTTFGEGVAATPSLVDGTVYANGSVELEQTQTGVIRREPQGPTEFQNSLSRYLSWYLSVSESRVLSDVPGENEPAVRIAFDGDPYPGVTNTTGTAMVTKSGLVRQLYRTHSEPGSAARIIIMIRVSDVGTTDVSAPEWAETA